MSELEQNKKINQLKRQMLNAIERIKTLELDVEPEGRISQAFSVLSDHIDGQFEQVNKRLNNLEHQMSQMNSKMEIMLQYLTGIDDLPEE
jgi:uncharacterized protein (DUF2267 family)